MKRLLLIALIVMTHSTLKAQPRTDSFLRNLLTKPPGKELQQVVANPQTYRVQVIYTRINRNRNNKPSFTNYYFNYDPGMYFNPASVVKLPLAFLSLEKLQKLKKYGVTKDTPLHFDSSFAGQVALYRDSTAANGLPSIAQFIRRAFLISENDPYNRMYQFVGQKTINRSLHAKGYPEVRITRQFMGFTEEQNRHTNAIRFLKPDGATFYHQPPLYNTDSFDFSHVVKLGTAYYNRNDSLIHEPFDFTRHNNIALGTLQKLLQSVLFPKSVRKKQRFHLSIDDYTFLYQYLSQYPSETPYPKYDTSIFYDSYVKFFFRNSTRRMPAHVRVFNKVGWAYGFLTDVSYVIDFEKGIEYMLAATLYVNPDGILNDDKYAYDELGYPLLKQLGDAIYQYELIRPRRYKPDLSGFRLRYDHRDPQDNRPSIKDADN